MDLLYDLPQEITNRLLCFICGKYLSCGPVKEENGDLICGRCNSSYLSTSVQIAFEKILKNFTFPCQYDKQGCKERLSFNSSIQHEPHCNYRTLQCPSNSCTSLMRFADFHKHFEEYHTNLIISNGQFKLNLDQDSSCNLLTVQDNITIVIKYSYDSLKKCLHLNVETVPIGGELTHYKMQILNVLDNDNSINLSEQQYSVYESSAACAEKAVILYIEKYLFVLNNPSVIIFKILNKLVPVCKNISVSRILNDNLEESMFERFTLLESVRCKMCLTYVTSPGYIAYNECCNVCNPHPSRWPFYKEVDNYPCQWRGCEFEGTSANISQHMSTCQFKTIICPYYSSCKKGDILNTFLIEHLKTHAIHCSNPEKIIVPFFNTENSPQKSYFAFLNEKLVTFTVVYRDDDWCLNYTLADTVTMSLVFTHDHCRYISKVILLRGTGTYTYKQFTHTRNAPHCFEKCYQLTAIINIKREST